jgi:hypothetical protein
MLTDPKQIREQILKRISDEPIDPTDLAEQVDCLFIVKNSTTTFREVLWELAEKGEIEITSDWRIKKGNTIP